MFTSIVSKSLWINNLWTCKLRTTTEINIFLIFHYICQKAKKKKLYFTGLSVCQQLHIIKTADQISIKILLEIFYHFIKKPPFSIWEPFCLINVMTINIIAKWLVSFCFPFAIHDPSKVCWLFKKALPNYFRLIIYHCQRGRQAFYFVSLLVSNII